MDIIEMTRKLGVEIQQQEVFKNYIKAKAANDNDVELQDMIGQFNVIRMQLDQALSADEKDGDKVKELNAQLKDTYTAIMGRETMMNYNIAKGELDVLVNQINAIIEHTLDGDDPMTCDIASNCTGSCSTCSGCH
ncbi:MAG: YlbF family regulator [Ruminococcaceae bacterium]|nr:YlbF family regulator [Oscillospiraceae bacterium]